LEATLSQPDPSARRIDAEGGRVGWLHEVGAWTYAARRARAEKHTDIARSAPEQSSLARWHEGRARGQLERIERVEDCGSTSYELCCKSCGVVAPGVHKRTCASWRYCVSCRGSRAADYRERINEARERWIKHARSYERERFLTLTIPHSALADDVKGILAAWERFTRGLRRWLRQRGTPMLAYVRAMEITASGGGHVHLHVWIGSPFLPHAVLRVLWGRALQSDYVPVRPLAEVLAELPDERSRRELQRVARWRGRERAWVPWPVLDVRQVRGDVADELVKYMLKDMEAGELIDPLTAANLIEASEGTRVVATSRGYWVVTEHDCEHCGEPRVFLVLSVPGRADPSLRTRPGSDHDP
jgi:hypothetical protein